MCEELHLPTGRDLRRQIWLFLLWNVVAAVVAAVGGRDGGGVDGARDGDDDGGVRGGGRHVGGGGGQGGAVLDYGHLKQFIPLSKKR